MLKKRILAAALCLCLLAGTAAPAYALEEEPPEEPVEAPERETPASVEEAAEAPEANGEAEALEEEPEAQDTPVPLAEAAGGTCGKSDTDNVQWKLENGTLTIYGTGQMADYSDSAGPWGVSATRLVIEEGVKSIGDFAFERCKSLTGTLVIPASVTSIGRFAFAHCTGLTGTLKIPGGVTSIKQGAFLDTGFTGPVSISENVGSIEHQAFALSAGLTGIDVHPENTVYASQDGVLFSKDMSSLLCFPAGKTAHNYQIPGTVTYIGDCAFQGCRRLTGTLDIPGGVTSIGGVTFDTCFGVTAIRIPGTVTSIGMSAFWTCPDLEELIVDEGNPSYASGDGVLFNKSKTELIKYPAGKSGSSYEIPNTVITIIDGAFGNCSSLTSVSIPTSVKTIEEFAFDGCSGLKTALYAGSENEWQGIKIGSRGNGPLLKAEIYYNGKRPPLEPDATIDDDPSGAAAGATVTIPPASLAAISGAVASGKDPAVFAAVQDGSRVLNTVQGKITDPSNGKIGFTADLKPNDRLFFLDPDTFIPLAKPAVLK